MQNKAILVEYMRTEGRLLRGTTPGKRDTRAPRLYVTCAPPPPFRIFVGEPEHQLPILAYAQQHIVRAVCTLVAAPRHRIDGQDERGRRG